MLTRRDVTVRTITLCTTLCVTFGALALALTEPSRMGSSAFDWNAIQVEPTKIGAQRRFFRAPTPTLDELSCHVTTLNPGEWPHPPHKHPEEELLIIKEGTVEAYLSDGKQTKTQRLGPGSVIFQASNQMHTIRNVGQTPATYHVIQWKSPGRR